MHTPRTGALLLALTLVAGCSSGSSNNNDDAAVEAATDAPSDSGSTTDAMDDTTTADVTSADDAVDAQTDAASPFGDTGALGDPAWVDVDVRTSTSCPALTPCGGNVVGTWDVTGVCIEVPLGALLNQCTGASVTHAGGRARGRVTFDGTVAHRVAESNAEVDLFVPAVCANFAGGCPGLQSAIQMQNPDSACTATPSGDCNCTSRTSSTINDTDGYSIQGNEIVSATLHKHWAYCIASDALTYQDTSPSGPREPGIVQLGRRN